MKIIGYILLGVGALLALASFGTDTAPEGTHNIGLMQEQMMLFHSGGVLIFVGALFTAVSVALSRIEAAGIIPPAGTKALGSNSGSKE